MCACVYERVYVCTGRAAAGSQGGRRAVAGWSQVSRRWVAGESPVGRRVVAGWSQGGRRVVAGIVKSVTKVHLAQRQHDNMTSCAET